MNTSDTHSETGAPGCDHVHAQLTAYVLGDLPEPEQVRMRSHLDDCESCQAAVAEVEPTLELLRAALAAPSDLPQGLSPAGRARVLARAGRPTSPAKRWFVQRHPWLTTAAAAGLMGGFVLLAINHGLQMKMPGRAYAKLSPSPAAAGGDTTVLSDEVRWYAERGEEAKDMPAFVGTPVAAPQKSLGLLRPSEEHGSRRGTTVDHDGDGLDDNFEDRPEATPAPVEEDRTARALDKLAEVNSPVVIRGTTSSRSAGRGGGGGDPRDAGRARQAAKESEKSAEVYQRVATQPAQPAPGTLQPDATGLKAGSGSVSAWHFDASGAIEAPASSFTVVGGHAVNGGNVAPADPFAPAVPEPPPPPAGGETSVSGADSDARLSTRGRADGRVTAGYVAQEKQVADAREDNFFKYANAAQDGKTETKVLHGLPISGERSGLGSYSLETEHRRKAPAVALGDQPVVTGMSADPAPTPVSKPSGSRSRRYESLIKPSPAEARSELAGNDVAEAARVAADAFTVAGHLTDAEDDDPDDPFEVADELFRSELLLAEAEAEEEPSLDGTEVTRGDYGLTAVNGRKGNEKARPAHFRAFGVNPFITTLEQPFSTFAIDVDTASYTVSRNYMTRGYRPPAESVRTEEFVNFFDYAYRPPERDTFKIYTELAPSKFGRGLNLLKIGVKGRRLGREEERRAVLTFLVDTSGSMDQPDRMGLVKRSLHMVVDALDAADRVAIVQYGSEARLLLEHTPAAELATIKAVIDGLQCSGSTNLEKGMRRAYRVAAQAFEGGAENRVLLLSDGVATLGTGTATDILADVAQYRRQGITCSVFGFGMGTYDDVMLETLANKGDGTYQFVDSEREARRIFVDDLSATLNTIATDVKIQVEFMADRVARYRQLGYENRQLKKEDFRNDTVDAGEVGSGQSVTALYELDPAPAAPVLSVRVPRTQQVLAMVRVRYRRVDTGKVEEIERAVTQADLAGSFDAAPLRFRLAACVAEFAEILRGSPFAAGSDCAGVADVLRPVALELHLDRRVRELVGLVEGADGLSLGGEFNIQ